MVHLEKRIIVLAGLPLTGKTTLGEELALQTDSILLDVDKARQELAPGKDWLGPDREREIMLAAYRLNHERAKNILDSGRAVILVATYSRPAYHDMIRQMSSDEHVPLDVFILDLSQAAAAARIAKRVAEGSDSNIQSIESYMEVKNRYEPFPGSEVLDASQSTGKLAELVLRSLV